MLKERIQADTRAALKSGEKDRLKTLRLLSAAIKQVEVDERREVDEPRVLAIIEKMVKQRRESARQFAEGGRQDLADAELAEIEVLEQYLPEPLPDDELETLISAAIDESGASTVRDMGKVMGLLRPRVQGRADMAAVGARVRSRLG